MNIKLLIVDDDLKLQNLLKKYFSHLNWEVLAHFDGDGVPELLDKNKVDLVLLDMMLPKKNGLEVLAEIRERSKIPVLILTARGESEEKIIGLEAGADDYLAKPFEPRELQARIKAIIRRTEKLTTSIDKLSSITFSDLTLEPRKQTLSGLQNSISLNDATFRIMQAFMKNPELVLDRDQIMNLTHGRDSIGFERSIDVQISKLRQILNQIIDHDVSIRTVWGKGYILQELKDK